ncbi:MAG: chorismate mutase [Caulobacteraceae bacterium]|nr:chorismate mutase [Caulobacteraceae bacterium]
MTGRKTPSLDEVRARIDAVDAELLRLVDERAALAQAVQQAKREAGQDGQFGLRPARETQVLRRILDMPRQAADPGLIVRLWRELMGHNLGRQGAFHLAAWGGRTGAARITELARQRFGQSVYLRMVDKPEMLLSEAKTLGGVGVGLLTNDSAWWARLLVEPKLSAFAVLPCLATWGAPEALAVAEVPMEPSGASDETLWVTDSAKQHWEIEIDLSRDGVAARLLTEANGLKLFSLAGFYMKSDERLARAPGRLTGVIGAAPAPFDL